jgi:hypothetical protein
MERCIAVVAMNPRGHSHAKMMMPRTRLIVCRAGKGFTAPSRFFVRKSQKILGQKKPSIAAATWSGRMLVWMFQPYAEGRHTDCCGEDDEASPVVLNELSHLDFSFVL